MAKRPIDPQPGNRLHEIRQHREISQGRLANAIGVTVGTIQNYEHGRAVLGVDRLEQLAHALQCEPVELLAPLGSPLPRYWDSRRQRYFPPRPGGPARRIGTTIPPHLALAALDGVTRCA